MYLLRFHVLLLIWPGTSAGGLETMENKTRVIVDVRDVAGALLLTYERPEASGRYVCAPHIIQIRDLVGKLRSMFPDYNYPKK